MQATVPGRQAVNLGRQHNLNLHRILTLQGGKASYAPEEEKSEHTLTHVKYTGAGAVRIAGPPDVLPKLSTSGRLTQLVVVHCTKSRQTDTVRLCICVSALVETGSVCAMRCNYVNHCPGSEGFGSRLTAHAHDISNCHIFELPCC